MSFTDQNSIIPTDAQYDEHFAHRCVDCDTRFSNVIPVAGVCTEGSLCQDCFDARLAVEAEEATVHNPENIPDTLVPPGWRFLTATEFNESLNKATNKRFRIWVSGKNAHFSDETWDTVCHPQFTYITEINPSPTNPFHILAAFNSAAQFCSENLQGDVTFLNFVMNLPRHYLKHSVSYLHTLFTDKHFSP